jgi:hypothetical protein
MELTQVKNVTLSDGNRYSGWCVNNYGEILPQGCGKKLYAGYYIYGNFKEGEVNGPAIESHDMYMKTMQFKNNSGNGWGLCMNRGQLSEFGYYKNGKLETDLSDFVLWYFTKMQNAGRDENMLSVYTFNATHEVSELLIGYKASPVQNGVGLVGMGFHFMSDGSVWMGNTATRRFTGKLIHFCSNGTVDCGDFENGDLKQRMELQDIINEYYGTFEYDEDDIFANLFGKREPNHVREQFRNAMEIEPNHNYFNGLPNNLETAETSNKFTMQYHVREIDFSATGNFVSIGESGEDWVIGDEKIISPHGVLDIDDAIFVEDGPLVGVQFSVSGWLRMDDFKCSNGDEDEIFISTLAVMRQPHNAWVWAYAFDENNEPIVNFCGFDDLDGLANFIPFLKRKYLKK